MMKNKILGIFKALPLESLTAVFIASLVNSDHETVTNLIKELIQEGHLKGKRTYKLIGKLKEVAQSRV